MKRGVTKSIGESRLPPEAADAARDDASSPVDDQRRSNRASSQGNVEGVDQFQREKSLSGIEAVVRMASFFGIRADVKLLSHQLGLSMSEATSSDVAASALRLGLTSEIRVGIAFSTLQRLARPCILKLLDGRYVVLGRTHKGLHEVLEGPSGPGKYLNQAQMEAIWSGEVITLQKLSNQQGDPEERPSRFSVSSLLDVVWKYRRPLKHVLIASIGMQLFALASPLLLQVIIDKVLVHHSRATLVVVGMALVLAAAFEVTLQYLRAYALSHTACRIDVELGRNLVAHLFKLPMDYFDRLPAGQVVARVRELEGVRAFITGQGILSIIDVVFATLFVCVLAVYSLKLTLIVIAAIPVYLAIGFVVTPSLRRRAKTKFGFGALSQQFLVESVVGAQTLKATASEPVAFRQWDERLSGHVAATFRMNTGNALAQSATQFTSKVATAAVLYFGALMVFSGAMTVGQLIAFNLIARQLTAPLLRLSRLWQEVQQFLVSIERLGDVMNEIPEPGIDGSLQYPPMRGEISIDSISFGYGESESYALNNLSLHVPQGQVIGIVGRSGSGKSTLAKIIQRLHVPQRGSVEIDGFDLSKMSPVWIRSQMGVVHQDSHLFNRTIHDNIALSSPSMTRGEVMVVAKLAGAHEFIKELPDGYDTLVHERGANLSGGQRQRIAIARALARRPKILLFDEATSSLDYESEAIIQANMREMARGRTVVVIAHRVSAVKNCQRIIVIDRGQIVEDGSPAELLENKDGFFRQLWKAQSGGELNA